MLSPKESESARRKLQNSRSYRKVLEEMVAKFPEIEPDTIRVSGGTFSNPPKNVIVDFESPDRYTASVSGTVAGASAHNVEGEVEDSQEGIVYVFQYDTGSVTVDTITLAP